MIRVTAPLPATFDAQALADQVGALGVNVIEPDLLAAYWDDDDPQALTAEAWAEVAAAHVPVTDGPSALDVLATMDPADLGRLVTLAQQLIGRADQLDQAVAAEDPQAGVAVVNDAVQVAAATDEVP